MDPVDLAMTSKSSMVWGRGLFLDSGNKKVVKPAKIPEKKNSERVMILSFSSQGPVQLYMNPQTRTGADGQWSEKTLTFWKKVTDGPMNWTELKSSRVLSWARARA